MWILPVTGHVIISCRSPRRRHVPRQVGVGESRRCATTASHAVAGGSPLRVPRAPRARSPSLSGVAASPVGRRPTHRLSVPARARGRMPCVCLSAPARAASAPLAFVGGWLLPLPSPLPLPRLRRAAGARAPAAAAVLRPLPVPAPPPAWGDGRGGATAADCTRLPRRRGWPPPTRGRQRPVLLAHPSRPPQGLGLDQQPEGHSALLLFLSPSLCNYFSLPAGPEFRSAMHSSFGGTSLACLGIIKCHVPGVSVSLVILAGKSDLATREARIQIPLRLEASLMLSEIDRSDGASDCQHRDRIYVSIVGIDIKRPLPRTCEGQVAAI